MHDQNGGERMGCGGFGSKFGRRARPLGAAVLLLAGCGGDGGGDLGLSVGATAQFQAQAGPPRVVGYQLVVVIEQVETSTRPTCPTLPSTLHLLISDQEVPPVFDPTTGCLNTDAAFALTPQVGTVTVDAKDGKQLLAHAEFDGLTPGAGATLAVPADGQVQAGDEIVVVPPPALPTGEQTPVTFYPLDDTAAAAKLYPPQLAERLADGIHVPVPVFDGRAAVTVLGMPYVPQPSYSCPGFDICTANADDTLGPVFVTEGP
jgi:hypothetical protein